MIDRDDDVLDYVSDGPLRMVPGGTEIHGENNGTLRVPVASLVAPFVVEGLMNTVHQEIENKIMDRLMPSEVHRYFFHSLEDCLQLSFLENDDAHEEDEEESKELKPIPGDSWMRLNIPKVSEEYLAQSIKVVPLGLLQPVENPELVNDVYRESDEEREEMKKTNTDDGFYNVGMNTWKNHAVTFITDFTGLEDPTPVLLITQNERPNSTEQKLRLMQQQQSIRDKQHKEEERIKQENLEKERHIARSKGEMTYDYDGKYIEVKSESKNRPGPQLHLGTQ